LTDDQIPIVFLERIYGESSGCPCWERQTDLRALNALLEQKYARRCHGDTDSLLENEILILEREAASIIRERADRDLVPLKEELIKTVQKVRALLGIED
jgi:hypothetical protein